MLQPILWQALVPQAAPDQDINFSNHGKSIEFLPDLYESFLFACADFYDDLDGVVKSLVQHSDSAADIKMIRAFREKLKPLRAETCAAVNAIKHNQSRLRSAYVAIAVDSLLLYVPCFIIETVIDDAVKALRAFHRENVFAVSIPSDLIRNVACLFAASDVATKFLVSKFGMLEIEPATGSKGWTYLIDIAFSLPRLKAPGDAGFFVPEITIGTMPNVSLTPFPTSVRATHSSPPIIEMITWGAQFEGDGVTRSFPIPFPMSKTQ